MHRRPTYAAGPLIVALALTYSIADQNFAQTKSLGILRLSTDLLRHLAVHPEVKPLTVFTNRTLTNSLQLPPHVTVENHDSAIGGRVRRLWWDQRGVYAAARRTGHEWLLLPKGFASGLARCPVKLAAYVHDVMPDYYWQHYRGETSRLENAYFRWALRSTLRHATVILTNSLFTAAEVRRIAAEIGIRRPPIRHVGIGFVPPKAWLAAPRTDIVVLASPWPHKRTALAVEYLDRWQTASQFDGMVHWVGRFPAGLPVSARANWKFHARVADEEYGRLQQQARAVIYFSDYEGFGMPPVEATLAGACPVYSDIAAIREGMEGRGEAFDNANYQTFTRALDRALTTPEAKISQWAAELLQRHNWDAVVARLVDALSPLTDRDD